MNVLVLPEAFDPIPTDLQIDWRIAQRNRTLIPWELADVYFRPTEIHVDMCSDPPTIGPGRPSYVRTWSKP